MTTELARCTLCGKAVTSRKLKVGYLGIPGILPVYTGPRWEGDTSWKNGGDYEHQLGPECYRKAYPKEARR